MRQLVTAAGLGLAILLGALTEPVVLLLAVALDSISRRSRGAHGKA